MTLTQITQNVYKLRDSNDLFFLKASSDEMVIVDSGNRGSKQQILQAVRDLGYAPHQVTHILVTQGNIDHVNKLKRVKRATGARLIAGQKTISDTATLTDLSNLPGWLVTLAQKLLNNPVQADRTVIDGEVLDIAGGIHVLHGHGPTPDNIAYFWEQERVLIVSDLMSGSRLMAVTSH